MRSFKLSLLWSFKYSLQSFSWFASLTRGCLKILHYSCTQVSLLSFILIKSSRRIHHPVGCFQINAKNMRDFSKSPWGETKERQKKKNYKFHQFYFSGILRWEKNLTFFYVVSNDNQLNLKKKKGKKSFQIDPLLVQNVRPCSLRTGHDCDVNKNQSPVCVCPEVPRCPRGLCSELTASLPFSARTLRNPSQQHLWQRRRSATQHTHFYFSISSRLWRSDVIQSCVGTLGRRARLYAFHAVEEFGRTERSVVPGWQTRRAKVASASHVLEAKRDFEGVNISALFQVLDGLPGTSGCSCVSAVPGSTVTSACTSPESNLSIWTSGHPSRSR